MRSYSEAEVAVPGRPLGDARLARNLLGYHSWASVNVPLFRCKRRAHDHG